MSNVFEDLGFQMLNTGVPAGQNFTNKSVAAGVTGVASPGTPLAADVNCVTAGASALGVSLPAIQVIGQEVKVINVQGSVTTVWTLGGTAAPTINGTAGTTGVTIAATAGLGTNYIATTLSTWVTG